MTLIEAVLATTLLAIASGSLFSAVGYLWKAQTKQQHYLGAAEVANRLILQYLDDKTKMPSPAQTLDYGNFSYRWRLDVDPITLEMPAGVSEAGRVARAELEGQSRQNRPRRIAVTVWLSEVHPEGANQPYEGITRFRLTRLMDPFATRNPDSYRKQSTNPIYIEEIFGNR